MSNKDSKKDGSSSEEATASEKSSYEERSREPLMLEGGSSEGDEISEYEEEHLPRRPTEEEYRQGKLMPKSTS